MPQYPLSGSISVSSTVMNHTRMEGSAPDSKDWRAEGLVTPAKDRNGGSSGVGETFS